MNSAARCNFRIRHRRFRLRLGRLVGLMRPVWLVWIERVGIVSWVHAFSRRLSAATAALKVVSLVAYLSPDQGSEIRGA
jgi:hypothetical protein